MDKSALSFLLNASRFYRLLGYLAIWPAMYSLGVYALALLGTQGTLHLDTLSTAYILLCAHACYLFDRVKITDRRQDPADAIALPTRSLIFSRFAKPIRVLIGFELIAAMFAGWFIHPLLTCIPLLAMLVVHIYAGRGATPDAPRLKDLPALKAFIIACGHIALFLMVLWSNQQLKLDDIQLMDIIIFIGTWFIVAGDAVLCDVDDLDADRIYRTQSLAVIFGPHLAWLAALGLLSTGSLFITLASESTIQMLALGATLVLSTIITRNNTNHRDLVDCRLLPIVLLAAWRLS